MNATAAQLPVDPPGSGRVTGAGHVFAAQVGSLDEGTIRLVGLIDPGFLAEAGWDPLTRTLRPAPEHPLLGPPGLRRSRLLDHLRAAARGLPGVPAPSGRGRAVPGRGRAVGPATGTAVDRPR